MSPVIWVPWRPSRDRLPLLNAVLPTIRATGYPVVFGDSGHHPFSIANTWNQCAERSPRGWDVAVRWGADFMIPAADQIHAAVDATADAPYVHAFQQVTKLTMRETTLYLRTGVVPRRDDPRPFGGVSAVTREAFEAVGGYDPRFVGWGHEDRAFRHSLQVLCGPTASVPGRMVMLRHPGRAHRPQDSYYKRQDQNWALFREYERITDPDELEDHIWRVRRGT